MVTKKGYRVGIECDGKEYHDSYRDEWRDAIILGENHLDAIYRYRGADITYHIEDILFLTSKLDPDLFSHRGRINLDMLASWQAHTLMCSRERGIYHIFYFDEREETGNLFMEVKRTYIPEGQRRFWKTLFQRTKDMGGGKLDDLIKKYRGSNSTI